MKKQVVGINHLSLVASLLDKSNALLSPGLNIHPYSVWRDKLAELAEEIKQYVKDEERLGIDLEGYNED